MKNIKNKDWDMEMAFLKIQISHMDKRSFVGSRIYLIVMSCMPMHTRGLGLCYNLVNRS